MDEDMKSKRLTEPQITALKAFEGYGRADAPVWFLGMEEKGKDWKPLLARAKWESVMDLKEAHETLEIYEHHRAKDVDVALQPTWRRMCTLMVLANHPELLPEKFQDFLDAKRPRGHEVAPLWAAFQLALKRYQSHRLGRANPQGDTFLCELLPIPKPTSKAYPFAEVLPWPNYPTYTKAVRQDRIDLLSNRLAENPPEVVIAYGREFWESYEQTFFDPMTGAKTRFSNASPEQSALLKSWRTEASGKQGAELRFALHQDRTLIVLAHHFSRMNGYSKLAELAAVIRQHRDGLKRHQA